jgi:hypothetical protein
MGGKGGMPHRPDFSKYEPKKPKKQIEETPRYDDRSFEFLVGVVVGAVIMLIAKVL